MQIAVVITDNGSPARRMGGRQESAAKQGVVRVINDNPSYTRSSSVILHSGVRAAK